MTRRSDSRSKELAKLREAVEAVGVRFPFDRGKYYPLRALRDFEDALAVLRHQHPTFGDALRDPDACPWVKVRNDELIPLDYLARHERLADDVTFCLMEEGSDIDVMLGNEGVLRRLQVTTAGPMWRRRGGELRDWGYDQRKKMRKLNNDGQMTGYGPFEEQDGKITNWEEVRTTAEIMDAFVEGLAKSLANKAHQRTRDCELAVYVESSYNLRVPMFQEAVQQVTVKVPLDNFIRVHVFGGPEGYYVPVR